jgi:hypothetical protein
MAAIQESTAEFNSRESRSSSNEDRRIYFREKVLLSDLQLQDGTRGIVLDISEQGLAMQSAQTLNTTSNPRLRFQLSQSTKWVEVEGRLAWISPSRYAAGVEFNDLSYDALVAIKTWMFEIASLGERDEWEIDPSDVGDPRAPAERDGLLPNGNETERIAQTSQFDVLDALTEEARNKMVARERQSHLEPALPSENRPSVEIAAELNLAELRAAMKPPVGYKPHLIARWPVNAALILWAVILLTFLAFGWLYRRANSRPPEQITERPRAGNASLEPTGVALSASGSASNATAPPLDLGFVLQVAAMQSESSALATADSFSAKNLSVFVMKPAAGNLYLVLIGPFSDGASAANTRAKLKRQGFDAIQMRTSSLQ